MDPLATVLDPTYRPAVLDAPDEGRHIPPHIPGYVDVLDGILTPEECRAIIDHAEAVGFKPASLYTDAQGREHFSENRKSSRCIVDSHGFVERLWQRLAPFVPPAYGSSLCAGLNERLRILRYDPGDEFKPHSDGSYCAPGGAISKITILLYLNAGYTGGYTEFMNDVGDAWIPVEPDVGRAALQDQALLHRVPPLQTGRKYVLRTEVMYQPVYTQGEYKEITVRL